MGWKAMTEYKRGATPLLDVLYRDGFLFFVCLFIISLVNASVIKLSFSFAWMQCAFHSILTSRVILHLHQVNAGGNAYEGGTLSTLRFSDRDIAPVSDTDMQLNSFESNV